MRQPKRKICVVTGSRAEYGLLYWLLSELKQRNAIELQLVVSGSHLSENFGNTENFIAKDGFEITYRVDALPFDDTQVATAESVGNSVVGFTKCFAAICPDVVVVLGDRYEIFAAASAALMLRLPLAHIHGGELTAGAIDDAIRHSITKMSHLHFTAADEYRNRVLQLGEDPSRVYNVGAVGLEWLQKSKLLTRDEWEDATDLKLAQKNILLVFHPETLSGDSGINALNEVLKALDQFEGHLFISASNADPAGRTINNILQKYVAANSNKRFYFQSLGHRNFLSLLKHVDLIVGNSSSGILEAPAVRTPTLNVGTRQDGRLRSSSIFDCLAKAKHISDEVRRILSTDISFAKIPYDSGEDASKKMADVLETFELDTILNKHFFDMSDRSCV